MGKRRSSLALFVGLFAVSGCGGRVGPEEFGSVGSGGKHAAGGVVSNGGTTDVSTDFSGYGGKAQPPAGGSYSTGGTTATGGVFATPSGGATSTGTTGGTRFATGGSTSFSGNGGKATPRGGSFSTGGKALAAGCSGLADCPVFVGGRGGTSGNGDAGGVGTAEGGTSSTIPRCVPGASAACACTDGSPGAQVCQADGTYAACRCLLADMRAKILGAWKGTRGSPWDGTHPVEMAFYANGNYSVRCTDECYALYWGNDGDSTEMLYSIETVNESGTGFGHITFYFDVGDTGVGEMRDITLDSSANGLTFAVWNGQYGPLNFVLTR
jgi:hypothetical protein